MSFPMADVIAAHPWGRPELIETCGEILLILATPAGRMVVDAASAGGRKMTERGYVQLMGHETLNRPNWWSSD